VKKNAYGNLCEIDVLPSVFLGSHDYVS